jgi:MFS transporter, MHS family, proline/betaine transporter
MTDRLPRIPSERGTVVAGAIGNVLEWYDFAIYGFFAATIGRQFFPGSSEVDSLIAAFGVFAAGYLMRPIGGLVFGYIGDTHGRKATLVLSTAAMAIPTFAIGLLPTAAQIGTLAPGLLVAFRLLQGLSIGGEYTASLVYLVERAHLGRRGLFGTFSILGGGIGTLAGAATATLISAALPSAAVESWGWRVPFLCGILIGLVGLYLRRQMPDTPNRPRGGEARLAKLARGLRTEWPAIPRIAGLNVMHAVGFFMLFIYLKTYLQEQVGIARTEALAITTIGLIALMACTAAFGAWSDRVGRKPVLIGSALAMVVLAYPLLVVMNQPSFGILLAGQLAFAVIVGAYAGTAPATIAEMLPASVRVTGSSLGYNLCMALFGGTTPVVTVYLIKVTHTDLTPAYYLMAAAAVSLAVVLGLKETAKRPLA